MYCSSSRVWGNWWRLTPSHFFSLKNITTQRFPRFRFLCFTSCCFLSTRLRVVQFWITWAWTYISERIREDASILWVSRLSARQTEWQTERQTERQAERALRRENQRIDASSLILSQRFDSYTALPSFSFSLFYILLFSVHAAKSGTVLNNLSVNIYKWKNQRGRIDSLSFAPKRSSDRMTDRTTDRTTGRTSAEARKSENRCVLFDSFTYIYSALLPQHWALYAKVDSTHIYIYMFFF